MYRYFEDTFLGQPGAGVVENTPESNIGLARSSVPLQPSIHGNRDSNNGVKWA
jgi:hypothetical protein